MRVRVAYTIDADDDTRRAIRAYYGDEGLASRGEVKSWYIAHGFSMDDELSCVLDRLAEGSVTRAEGA